MAGKLLVWGRRSLPDHPLALSSLIPSQVKGRRGEQSLSVSMWELAAPGELHPLTIHCMQPPLSSEQSEV